MIKQIQKMKNKKGFTLIEIIVVLVILSILVAVALPTMFGYVEEARAKSYAQEARVGFLAAQWILVEQVLIGDLTPQDYAKAVEDLLNGTTAPPSPPPSDFYPSPPPTPIIDEERLLASFESKLQGVTFPWRSPDAGSITGFSDVVIDITKAQVTGITYTTTNFTITIGEGKTVTSKNSSPAANPGGATPICIHVTSTDCTICDVCHQSGIGSHTPGTSIGDCETCGVCGAKPSGGIHSPGADADCENAQVCDACGKELNPALGHTPSIEDCVNVQVCTVCSVELAAAAGHLYMSNLASEECNRCDVPRIEYGTIAFAYTNSSSGTITQRLTNNGKTESITGLNISGSKIGGNTVGFNRSSGVTVGTLTPTGTKDNSPHPFALTGYTMSVTYGFATYNILSVSGSNFNNGDKAECATHTPGTVADCVNAQVCMLCNATIVGALGHNWNNNVPEPGKRECSICSEIGNMPPEVVLYAYRGGVPFVNGTSVGTWGDPYYIAVTNNKATSRSVTVTFSCPTGTMDFQDQYSWANNGNQPNIGITVTDSGNNEWTRVGNNTSTVTYTYTLTAGQTKGFKVSRQGGASNVNLSITVS